MGINLRMKREKIKAVKRTILGKKIKNLRKKGILPANLYGKKIKSQALEVNLDEFRKFYKNAGKTTLIDVELDSKSYPVLIHKLQVHPVTEDFLHVDFHMVSLEEKKGGVEIAIADQGIGITSAEQARLFERFHRVKGVVQFGNDFTTDWLRFRKEI